VEIQGAKSPITSSKTRVIDNNIVAVVAMSWVIDFCYYAISCGKYGDFCFFSYYTVFATHWCPVECIITLALVAGVYPTGGAVGYAAYLGSKQPTTIAG
jgi:hypothetical protein